MKLLTYISCKLDLQKMPNKKGALYASVELSCVLTSVSLLVFMQADVNNSENNIGIISVSQKIAALEKKTTMLRN